MLRKQKIIKLEQNKRRIKLSRNSRLKNEGKKAKLPEPESNGQTKSKKEWESPTCVGSKW